MARPDLGLPSTSLAFGVVFAAVIAATGCWQLGYSKHRDLHYVDGQLVETAAPAPRAYESYLRARLALERGSLDEARGHAVEALRWQIDDPQLWTLKAEIEWQAGELDEAERDLGRALGLRPGYAEAERLLAQLRAQPDEHGSPPAMAAAPANAEQAQ